jgi:hypothetical protein
MASNNINTLTFDNHDTYIYYVGEKERKSLQQVILTPTNTEDTDTVTYLSSEANLFTNGVNNGVIKFNSFDRVKSNIITIDSSIGTIITKDGILMFNQASAVDSNKYLTLSGVQTKSLATYKSDKYANYLNVEIQIDFEDGYRIVTISY